MSTVIRGNRLSRLFVILCFFLPFLFIGQAAFASGPIYAQSLNSVLNYQGWGANSITSTSAGYCGDTNTYATPMQCNSASGQQGNLFWNETIPSAYLGMRWWFWIRCTDGTIGGSYASSTGQVLNSTSPWDGSTSFCYSPTGAHGFVDGFEIDAQITGGTKYCVLTSGNAPAAGWGNPSGATCAAPVAWCQNSNFVNATGSWDGSALAVRFGWNGAALPHNGVSSWSVVAPDPGTSTGATFSMSFANVVDGAPGIYYGRTSLATLSSMTARIYAPTDNGGNPGCYISVALSSVPISQTPTTTSAGDNSQPSSCSFYDLPCWIQKLFFPTHALDDWRTLKDTAQSHAPISLVVSGTDFIYNTFQVLHTDSAAPDGANDCVTAFHACADISTQDPTGINTDAHTFKPLSGATAAVQTTWGQVYYALAKISIYASAFFVIWKMVTRSFGGKGSAEGLE